MKTVKTLYVVLTTGEKVTYENVEIFVDEQNGQLEAFRDNHPIANFKLSQLTHWYTE